MLLQSRMSGNNEKWMPLYSLTCSSTSTSLLDIWLVLKSQGACYLQGTFTAEPLSLLQILLTGTWQCSGIQLAHRASFHKSLAKKDTALWDLGLKNFAPTSHALPSGNKSPEVGQMCWTANMKPKASWRALCNQSFITQERAFICSALWRDVATCQWAEGSCTPTVP